MTFPASPVNGQQAIVGNITYAYDSSKTAWFRITNAGTVAYTASNTPPSAAKPGDQWYYIAQDVLLEFIYDGTSGYWVDVISPSVSPGTRVADLVLSNVTINSTYVPVTVTEGGTGRTTLPANAVVIGNNADPVNYVLPGLTGNVLSSNGSGWISTNVVKYTAATSAPAGATAGDQWYDSSTDILYEYVNDGTQLVWIDIGSAPLLTNTAITGANLSLTGNGYIGSNFTVVGNLNLSSSLNGQLLITNATQATSTTTGAVRLVNGGLSISNGNLYVAGSAGNAIVATGALYAQGIYDSGSKLASTGKAIAMSIVFGG